MDKTLLCLLSNSVKSLSIFDNILTLHCRSLKKDYYLGMDSNIKTILINLEYSRQDQIEIYQGILTNLSSEFNLRIIPKSAGPIFKEFFENCNYDVLITYNYAEIMSIYTKLKKKNITVIIITKEKKDLH